MAKNGTTKHFRGARSRSYATYMSEPLFTVGGTTITRAYLTEIGVPHFHAARNLARTLAKIVGIRRAAKMALTTVNPLDLLLERGIGERAIIVGSEIIDRSGGSVDRWFGWDTEADVRKVATLKATSKKNATMTRRKRRAA